MKIFLQFFHIHEFIKKVNYFSFNKRASFQSLGKFLFIGLAGCFVSFL